MKIKFLTFFAYLYGDFCTLQDLTKPSCSGVSEAAGVDVFNDQSQLRCESVHRPAKWTNGGKS